MENFERRWFGTMLDCSRNAVMTVDSVKKWIDITADLGYNMLMLYTEDTYEVKNQPYFGYMRGRYSIAEMKEINAYCASKGGINSMSKAFAVDLGKYGIRSKEDLYQVAEAALSAPAIQWKGLMTMAPAAAEGEELRQVFAGLRQMRDELEQKYSVSLPELSMGMSGDYPAAIAEGATIVRIGTAIFGGRDYSK